MQNATDIHTHSIDGSSLSQLTMRELLHVQEGIRAIGDALCGVVSQPRYSFEKVRVLNAAGEVLDDLLDHMNQLRQTVFDIAEKAEPTTADEVEAKAWIMLQYQADCRDNMHDFVALAASLSAEIEGAKTHEDIRRAVA